MVVFKKQFLLHTKIVNGLIDTHTTTINKFVLHYHKDLEFCQVKKERSNFILLGSVFNYNKPEYSNQDILNEIADIKNLNEVFEAVNPYYGKYILLINIEEDFIIFNDPCAQAEVYYNSSYTSFGSQIKILEQVLKLEPNKDLDLKSFYVSKQFNTKKIFILNTTPFQDIIHLQPNHYLNVLNKKTSRFFPERELIHMPTHEVAKQAIVMLKGYLKAIANRHKLIIPVTGGYDSRVLFLASLDLNCRYFVCQHFNMGDKHHDIVIAKKLTALFGKKLEVIKDEYVNENDFNANYKLSIDYPRFDKHPDIFNENTVLINGNISEVARHHFVNLKVINGKKLAFFNGYAKIKSVIDHYNKWIHKNKTYFKLKKYNILDFFYWEENSANWTAKAKSEGNELGVNMMTPFNSRELLMLLMSAKSEDRGNFSNKLYDKIIYYLCNGDKRVVGLPINPSKQKNKALLMQKLGIFNFYQNLRVLFKG